MLDTLKELALKYKWLAFPVAQCFVVSVCYRNALLEKFNISSSYSLHPQDYFTAISEKPNLILALFVIDAIIGFCFFFPKELSEKLPAAWFKRTKETAAIAQNSIETTSHALPKWAEFLWARPQILVAAIVVGTSLWLIHKNSQEILGSSVDSVYYILICVATSVVAGAVIAFTNSKSAFTFLCTAGMCCLIATALLWAFPDSDANNLKGAIEEHFKTPVSLAYMVFLVLGAILLSWGQQSTGLLLSLSAITLFSATSATNIAHQDAEDLKKNIAHQDAEDLKKNIVQLDSEDLKKNSKNQLVVEFAFQGGVSSINVNGLITRTHDHVFFAVETEDTESKGTESKDTESKDTESKDTGWEGVVLSASRIVMIRPENVSVTDPHVTNPQDTTDIREEARTTDGLSNSLQELQKAVTALAKKPPHVLPASNPPFSIPKEFESQFENLLDSQTKFNESLTALSDKLESTAFKQPFKVQLSVEDKPLKLSIANANDLPSSMAEPPPEDSDRYRFFVAYKLYLEKNYREAMNILKPLMKQDSQSNAGPIDDVSIRYLWALCTKGSEEPQEARRLIESIARESPDTFAKVRFFLGGVPTEDWEFIKSIIDTSNVPPNK